jgi:hypothetical protein
MRVVSSRTVVFLLESCLGLTAIAMVVLCRRKLFTCGRIMIEATIFLTADPAPRLPTTGPYMKLILKIHAA